MKSSIVKSINLLPALSKTILDVNKICADKEAGINELAKAIEPDPMIVANLLKSANSTLYGFGREIRNVAQAVNLFGMSMTRSIVLGNSVRKLLNVDMKPYGITSDMFAEISSMQAILMMKWYSKIDKNKAEKLYLGTFLQETGKILISCDVMKEFEDTSFASEIELTNNIALVEKSYVEVTSAEVTAEVFSHWGFDKEFVEMIRFSDNPAAAPDEVKEFATALNIVKTIIPLNKPFSEQSINFGLRKARDAGYDHELLEDVIDGMLETLESQKSIDE